MSRDPLIKVYASLYPADAAALEAVNAVLASLLSIGRPYFFEKIVGRPKGLLSGKAARRIPP